MQAPVYWLLLSLGRGLPVLIWHTLLTLGILFILSGTYMVLTRQRFLKFINQHNIAASIAFGSVYLSFAIPLAFCLEGSQDALDIIAWAIPLGIIQFICFLIFDAIFQNLPKRVEQNDIALAMLVASIRLSISIILAGAIA